MRILTWNLNHGGGSRAATAAQNELIAAQQADIVILTEPSSSSSMPSFASVDSPRRRAGRHGPEAWVRILGRQVEPVAIQLPFERMAMAAHANVDGEALIVYGSVLPWNAARKQAPYLLAHERETAAELFAKVLAAQVADIQQLRMTHPGDTLIWAGDFNQPLTGLNAGFSNANRLLLTAALAELGLRAWNHHLDAAQEGCATIDLICGPEGRKGVQATRFEATVGGRNLSDHAGYAVET